MIRFNLETLFDIALNMEVAGENFYREASGICERRKVRELLGSLAEMEVQHRKLFSQMKAAIPAHLKNLVFEIKDPSEYLYFQNLINNTSIPMPRIDSLLRENPTEEEILAYAIDREKDTVVFYVTMKEFINPKEEARHVEKIIAEEVKHVQILTAILHEGAG